MSNWHALMKIKFIPAYNVSSLIFPFGGVKWGPLRTPTKQNFVELTNRIQSGKKKKRQNHKKSAIGRHGREIYNSKSDIDSLLADERSSALDVSVANGGTSRGTYEGGGGYANNELTSMLTVPLDMMAACGPKMGSGFTNQQSSSAHAMRNNSGNGKGNGSGNHSMVVMSALHGGGSVRHSSLQLRVNAHLCWTTSFILPPVFDKAPAALLKMIGVSHPPPCSIVMRHLKQVAELWKTKIHPRNQHNPANNTANGILTTCLQSVVLGCCSVIYNALNVGLVHVPTVRSLLSKSAFVVTDAGDFVHPGSVCVDLETHLGDLALAPPSYLPLPLHSVLKAAGSSSITGLDPPKVIARGVSSAVQHWNEAVRSLCFSHHLSDVVLVLVQEGESRPRLFPAHKLVLGMASPAFDTMFDGGFVEGMSGNGGKGGNGGGNGGGGGGGGTSGTGGTSSSRHKGGGENHSIDNRSRKTQVKLPNWSDGVAVELMLKYLYGFGNPLVDVRPTDKTIVSMFSLLRLSDFYDLEYLKSLVEVWLASNDIVDVFNVVSLLTHAHACRARQLTRYAVYCCREMFTVVSETKEWDDLDDALKRKVTDLKNV